ncbi:ABC transporter permease [Uliginosibacterium sp. sgz301328]|uniref:ABC transporter permease n=1 Tax=Uliginosibacterium sp. sgz301328 TaxID=3243764 RepID=UPI00359DD7D3
MPDQQLTLAAPGPAPHTDTHDEPERALGLAERLWQIGALRKALILIALALLWQGYATHLDNPLLFPTFSDTLTAWWDGIVSGSLLKRAGFTLQTLLTGYVLGIVIAAFVTALAVGSRIGNDLLETLTAMFNPLPAIALLPLSLIWFGLGNASLIFVLVHSVLWPVALSTHGGFKAVSPTLRMVGRNYGLSGLRLVVTILIPAAFPSILSGLKNGWAFAWRTLIAAELVFGVSSGGGGLGWFIYENKNQLEIPSVFAGLLSVIVIGLAVDNLVFRVLEAKTVRRWGMHA